MKRIAAIIAAVVVGMQAMAEGAGARITREFRDVTLAEALGELSKIETGYTIYFLHNEVEDFRVTTTIRDERLPNAIQQLIGFYPIKMTVDETDADDRKIFVEQGASGLCECSRSGGGRLSARRWRSDERERIFRDPV